jgi:hypothetical protein
VTPDPAGDGMNWYGYAGGDPVNRNDPTGLRSIDEPYNPGPLGGGGTPLPPPDITSVTVTAPYEGISPTSMPGGWTRLGYGSLDPDSCYSDIIKSNTAIAPASCHPPTPINCRPGFRPNSIGGCDLDESDPWAAYNLGCFENLTSETIQWSDETRGSLREALASGFIATLLSDTVNTLAAELGTAAASEVTMITVAGVAISTPVLSLVLGTVTAGIVYESLLDRHDRELQNRLLRIGPDCAAAAYKKYPQYRDFHR